MNELRKEYHNKTAGQIGEKARDLQTSYFTDEYVFWLEDQLKQGNAVRSISVYSSCDDERLDYRKNYVFHHFVSKRKALIEDKESGKLIEVHYSNFKFS